MRTYETWISRNLRAIFIACVTVVVGWSISVFLGALADVIGWGNVGIAAALLAGYMVWWLRRMLIEDRRTLKSIPCELAPPFISEPPFDPAERRTAEDGG